MTDPTPPVDLGALSAKLRQDDREFRRTFALGRLAGEDDAGPATRNEAVVGGELLARLMALIEARTGIDTAPGGGTGERLDRLLAAVPLALAPAWLLALEAEPTDGPGWEALIAGLTVQETYFFRDPDQLAFLRGQVLDGLVAARRHDRTARLLCWCAGCATGEEVYSLAILIVEALKEAGEAEVRPGGGVVLHPRWRITVLGTDIDRAVLRHAQAGRYLDFAMGPFRSLPGTLAGYFETVADEPPPPRLPLPPVRPAIRPAIRAVCRDIRTLSSFLPFNLAQPDPPVLDADVILCRNVLIYLSDRVRTHAQGLFHRALARDGHLVLGPTDTLKSPELFQPLWGPDTVLYRKR
jgi:chemotaxis protein methyltransferase CheR